MKIQKLIENLRDLRDDGIENTNFGKKLLKKLIIFLLLKKTKRICMTLLKITIFSI